MKQRPWRLTRRERVAMEWLRCALWDDKVLAIDIMRASRVLGWSPMTNDRFPDGMREWRIYRARVAIALRAALRADEDARCDESRARVDRSYDGSDYERSEMRGAAEDWHDSLREWPPLRQVSYEWPDGVPVPPSVLTVHVPGVGTYALPSRVPRALWDR